MRRCLDLRNAITTLAVGLAFAFLAPCSAQAFVIPSAFPVETAAVDGTNLYAVAYTDNGSSMAVVRYDMLSGLSQTVFKQVISDSARLNAFPGQLNALKARAGRVAIGLTDGYTTPGVMETSVLTMHADGSALEQIHKTSSVKYCGDATTLMQVTNDGAVIYVDTPVPVDFIQTGPDAKPGRAQLHCRAAVKTPHFTAYAQHEGQTETRLIRLRQPQSWSSPPDWARVRVAGKYMLVIDGGYFQNSALLWDTTTNELVARIHGRGNRWFWAQDVDPSGRVLVNRELARGRDKGKTAEELWSAPGEPRKLIGLRRSRYISAAQFCGAQIVEIFSWNRLVLRDGDGGAARTLAKWPTPKSGDTFVPRFDCDADSSVLRVQETRSRSRVESFSLR